MTVLLVLFAENPPVFFILYLLCGLSDLLDGYIARKTGTESKFGAKLDSTADLIMFAVITWFLVKWEAEIIMESMPFLLGVLVVRVANLTIAWLKFRSFVILHTLGNKATGLIVFLSPLILYCFHLSAMVNIMLGLAMLTAIEEGIIHIISPEPKPNRRSLFWR